MPEIPELEVVRIQTSELVEYKNNAKLHPNEQIDQIVDSIQQFGFNSPILCWHNDDGEPEIVSGHGRLLAARKLKLQELPVIFLDHLTPQQRRAYIIVDNKLAMNTEFDYDMLEAEIAEIGDAFDMEDFGFDFGAVDDMLEEDSLDYEVRKPQKAEYPFSQWVDEASNYVVLKFNTEQDWTRAISLLGLEKVRSHSTKKDGNGKLVFTGIGRVVDGNTAFERIAKAEEELRR